MTRVQPVSSAKSSWQFFLSHKQSESAAEALDLTYHLGRNACWLDVHQDDCSVQAMEDGVRNSTFFVCILSTGYLTSMYCLKELWWAFSFEKPIILCYRHMDNIGALLRELPSQFSSLSDISGIKLDRTHSRYFQVGVELIHKRVSQLEAKVAETMPAQALGAAQNAPATQHMSATANSSDPVKRILGKYRFQDSPLEAFSIVRSTANPGGVILVYEPESDCFGCSERPKESVEYIYDDWQGKFRKVNRGGCNDSLHVFYLLIDKAPQHITLKAHESMVGLYHFFGLLTGGLFYLKLCCSPGDNGFVGHSYVLV